MYIRSIYLYSLSLAWVPTYLWFYLHCVGVREHSTTLPQDSDADAKDRKEQLAEAQGLYRWNSTVRKSNIPDAEGDFSMFMTYAQGVVRYGCATNA